MSRRTSAIMYGAPPMDRLPPVPEEYIPAPVHPATIPGWDKTGLTLTAGTPPAGKAEILRSLVRRVDWLREQLKSMEAYREELSDLERLLDRNFAPGDDR